MNDDKKNKIEAFVKSVSSIEYAIEPYKEQLKDLKKEYKENNWLSSEEIRLVMQAYRMIRKGESIDNLSTMYDELAAKLGTP